MLQFMIMYKQEFKTGRWTNTIASPIDLNSQEMQERDVVFIHPGYQKPAPIHAKMMELLAGINGGQYFPIGVDTRRGYPGAHNPYFNEACSYDNRFILRRPTGLLQIIDALRIDSYYYIGHSRGVEIGLVATSAENQPATCKSMTLVNGLGTGPLGGLPQLCQANMRAWGNRREYMVNISGVTSGALESTAYFLTHIPRTIKEIRYMQRLDAWPYIDQATAKGMSINVFNAKNDPLIGFEGAQEQANKRPSINFTATEGSHSNIYGLPVIEQMVETVSNLN